MLSGPPGVTVSDVQLITGDIRQRDEFMGINKVTFSKDSRADRTILLT